MKTTIIISLLIICSVCKGQDSLQNALAEISKDVVVNSFLDTCHCYFTFRTEPLPKYDTIKCEMIVTDNSTENNKVVKIIGYCVEERNSIYVSYLDIIKQPVKKSITVWMCKEIK